MPKLSKYSDILDRVYALVVGIDYDQPTSLERDLAALEATIRESDLIAQDAANDVDSLSELLNIMPERNGVSGAELSQTASDIEEIINDMDYGNLREEDASILEDSLNDLVFELEKYFG